MDRLTSGRLARSGGVNLETVRYYERQGLLGKPPRTEAGYRIFPPEAVQRLRFIRRAQHLGFSLREIRELLSLRLKPGANRAEILARTDAKIADIDAKISSLKEIRKALQAMVRQCDGCGPVARCSILETLDKG